MFTCCRINSGFFILKPKKYKTKGTLMEVIIYICVGVICLAVGFLISRLISKSSASSKEAEADRMLKDAEKAADTIRREAAVEAKDAALKIKEEAEEKFAKQNDELRSRENRIHQREEFCDKRVESLDQRENQLSQTATNLENQKAQVDQKLHDAEQQLMKVAGMNKEEAKQLLLDKVRDDVTNEAAAIIHDSEIQTKAECDRKSREILSVAIQRMASDFTAERTITAVAIPSDDVKGRIIGREGRNIRSFEQITGVNLIIDDTPEAVTLSAHDPVRREIARITLENLIADGRIHPVRIEEMFKKAEAYVDEQINEAGKEATFDLGIHNLHPELVHTLGRLRYRTSYGQNVLQHSLEVANLAGIMAAELGLDPTPAKRAGLLHDLGKAIDCEVQGSHAVIGADLAKRNGEKPAIVHAIEAHHADVEPSTVLAVLIQAADAVSAARPGARRESYDAYIKRLEKLEEIANGFDGVAKTYAMQAGREVRVMVEPAQVDDAKATVLAHDIAKKIEEEMQYPGQIHVVVIRESRAEGIAK
jgi:ribonucrease Y